ncbi:DUF362 domain-containing protein [Acidobacteriota bacterium]
MSLFIDEEKCAGCESCVSICPMEAISTINNIAVVDHSKCKECLLCMEECPSNAIYQILNKEESVLQREEPVSEPVNFNFSPTKPSFWTDSRKQQMTSRFAIILSGITKLTSDFIKENSFQNKSIEGRGRLRKHKRRQRRW